MNILIAGGGTGGHLFPALAIGAELQRQLPQTDIHYVGSTYGLEKSILPQKNVPFTLLNIRGLQRQFSWQAMGRNLLLPFRLLVSWIKTVKLMQALLPVVVIGTGGYASAFPVRQALRSGIPVVLQEQNSYPGLVTRLYAGQVAKVCLGFAAARDHLNGIGVETGNPIYRDVAKYTRDQAADYFELAADKPVAFITGGSQGSALLNQTVAGMLDRNPKPPFQILWQTGKHNIEVWNGYASDHCRIFPFIDEMEAAYTLADLILSRAGALALSEIVLFGKPSILVPLASAAENHQYHNGKTLVDKGAALLVEERELNPDRLYQDIQSIFQDHQKMKTMGDAALAMAKPHALATIVDHILDVIKA